MSIKKKVIGYLNFGIFQGGCTFSNGFTYDELVKELKRQKLSEHVEAIKVEESFFKSSNYAYAKIVQVDKGKETNFFFLFTKEQFRFKDEDYIKLAHECLHICQCFLKDILDRDKESEAEAYLHSYLMFQCLSLIRGT